MFWSGMFVGAVMGIAGTVTALMVGVRWVRNLAIGKGK